MEKIIHVNLPQGSLEGMLKIPPKSDGIVLFAHGSGSSRLSPRNNFVAKLLNDAGLATLLIDLLTTKEDENYQTRFNINLLTERLKNVYDWLKSQSDTKDLRIGLFGSSTGAAAALQLAAALGEKITAVVSRGGRPDLALDVLDSVSAPTLLIVGGNDFGVIELNQKAYDQLVCHKHLEIIPHATHLFEEPGCLDAVAKSAQSWFQRFLSRHLSSSR